MGKGGRRPRIDQETRDFVPFDSGTDFDDEQVAVMAWSDPDDGGRRRAVVLPRSLSRLGDESRGEARHLQQLGVQLQELADSIDDQVLACRDAGVSWAGIGWCLGTTGEAARQRWG